MSKGDIQMKKTFKVLITCILALTLLSGCQGKRTDKDNMESDSINVGSTTTGTVNEDARTTEEEKSQESETDNDNGEVIEQTDSKKEVSDRSNNENENNDFFVEYNGKQLKLLQWDNEIDIEAIFGKPESDSTEVLGEGADTFTGSYLRIVNFNGLELTMLSPKDNGKDFLVLMMTVSISDYTIANGLKVGDSFETLKKAFPDIKRVEDGIEDGNISTYEIKDNNNNFIEFYLEDNLINEILIGNELQ